MRKSELRCGFGMANRPQWINVNAVNSQGHLFGCKLLNYHIFPVLENELKILDLTINPQRIRELWFYRALLNPLLPRPKGDKDAEGMKKQISSNEFLRHS